MRFDTSTTAESIEPHEAIGDSQQNASYHRIMRIRVSVREIWGRYIRELRSGMTQPELATKLATKQPTISGWETSRRGFTSDALDGALEAMGVEPHHALRRMAEISKEIYAEKERLAAQIEDASGPRRATRRPARQKPATATKG